jgi:ankyrin repeat protein
MEKQHTSSPTLVQLFKDEAWEDVESLLNNNVEDSKDIQPLSLHYAIAHGAPPKVVRLFLDHRPDLCRLKNGKDNNRIPLHVACGNKRKGISCDPNVLRMILEVHPDGAAESDEDGMLPLHCVCLEEASTEAIQLLLQANPKAAGTVDEDGNLPMHWVFHRNCDIQSIELLWSEAASGLEKANKNGSLPIHRACLNDAPASVVQKLLDWNPAVASVADGDGNLPIHLLYNRPSSASESSKNCEDVLRALLMVNPEGAATANNYGELALHRACAEGASDTLVRLLVEAYPKGVETIRTSTTDSDRIETALPLHIACTFDASLEIVQLLLAAYPKAASETDWTISSSTTTTNNAFLPIHLALRNNASVAIIEALLEVYPQGATKEAQGKLPLHYACILRAPLIVVQRLVEAYPDGLSSPCDTSDSTVGSLPLHLACQSDGPLDVVRFLIAKTNPEAATVPFDESGSLPPDFIPQKEASMSQEKHRSDAIKAAAAAAADQGEGNDGPSLHHAPDDSKVRFSDDVNLEPRSASVNDKTEPGENYPTLTMGTTICVEKHISEQGLESTNVFVLEGKDGSLDGGSFGGMGESDDEDDGSLSSDED